jgi:hypothetical protein
VYEKILSDLQSAGNAGEFYTPRAVTQFIVDQVDPKLGQKILDPACGTGGLRERPTLGIVLDWSTTKRRARSRVRAGEAG